MFDGLSLNVKCAAYISFASGGFLFLALLLAPMYYGLVSWIALFSALIMPILILRAEAKRQEKHEAMKPLIPSWENVERMSIETSIDDYKDWLRKRDQL